MTADQTYLVDLHALSGNPLEEAVWEDLDAWLLAGWTHVNGGQMNAHITTAM